MTSFVTKVSKRIMLHFLQKSGYKLVYVRPSTLPDYLPAEDFTLIDRISIIGNMIETEYGHDLSLRTASSVDKDSNPIPWFTYPAIQYLQQLDLSDKNVFEWGSGNSSSFFAEKAKTIISVEDDPDWYQKVSSQKRANQSIILLPHAETFEYILSTGKKFDIVIIDGMNDRKYCIEPALKSLTSNGIIILDNSDWYKNSARALREAGLIQVDMHGFGPINDYPWTTSFFFSRDFDFKPLSNIQPANPIGGLANVAD